MDQKIQHPKKFRRWHGREMSRLLFVLITLLALNSGLSFAQQLPSEIIHYPDLILHNGRILSGDALTDFVEAVAIRDKKFLAIGSNQRILQMAGPETVKKDLAGRLVIPGFISTDADNDFAGGNLYKETMFQGRLLGTQRELQEKSQILNRVAETVAKTPPEEFVFIRLPEAGQGFFVNIDELDALAPNNPVALSIDSTNMVINSQMLKLLTERIPLDHPHIVKDPDSGKPNGRIYGHATGVVGWDLRDWPKIDKIFMDEQRELMADLNKKGITTIIGHIQGFSLSVLNILWHQNEVTVRVRGSHDFLRQNPYAESYLRRLGNIIDFGLGDDIMIIGAGLASVDGNHDSGSAYTFEAKRSSGGYAFAQDGQHKWIGFGPHRRGWEDVSDAEKTKTEYENIQAAIKYGWNTSSIHNVGDKATQAWLDAIEAGLAQDDLALKPQFRPFGLDHNLFWDVRQDEQIKRLDVRRGLGKMFSGMESAVEIYGDRIHDVQPVPALIQKGHKVHIEGTRPFYRMERYITRKDDEGHMWGPDHAIDRRTALLMTTLWAARFIGEDHRLGSIQTGKFADLAVLGEDYFTVPAEKISDIPVIMTVMGGRIVHEQ